MPSLAAAVAPCPLCERPNLRSSDHHLVPKSQGGRLTLAICRDCHSAIHAVFTNKELATTYHTVEALRGHAVLAPVLRFIARQDPGRRTSTARPRARAGRR